MTWLCPPSAQHPPAAWDGVDGAHQPEAEGVGDHAQSLARIRRKIWSSARPHGQGKRDHKTCGSVSASKWSSQGVYSENDISHVQNKLSNVSLCIMTEDALICWWMSVSTFILIVDWHQQIKWLSLMLICCITAARDICQFVRLYFLNSFVIE